MKFDNLIETLRMIGQLVKDQYKGKLKQGGNISSGKLFNSIEYKLVIEENSVKLYFVALDYWIFIEEGRKAGKMPPINVIKKWMLSKGIPAKNEIAWKITRNIGKHGIKAKPYLKEITSTIPSFKDDIMIALEKDIEIELNKLKEVK